MASGDDTRGTDAQFGEIVEDTQSLDTSATFHSVR